MRPICATRKTSKTSPHSATGARVRATLRANASKIAEKRASSARSSSAPASAADSAGVGDAGRFRPRLFDLRQPGAQAFQPRGRGFVEQLHGGASQRGRGKRQSQQAGERRREVNLIDVRPGSGRDACAEREQRHDGLGVGPTAVTARVGGPVIRREHDGRAGGQQANDAIEMCGDSPGDVGVRGRLHPAAVTGVIEADQVKDQEIRRRLLLQSVGQPPDDDLVLQRLGAKVIDDLRDVHLRLDDDKVLGKQLSPDAVAVERGLPARVARQAGHTRQGGSTPCQLCKTSNRSGKVPVAIERTPAVLMVTGLVRTRPDAASGCACAKRSERRRRRRCQRGARRPPPAPRAGSARAHRPPAAVEDRGAPPAEDTPGRSRRERRAPPARARLSKETSPGVRLGRPCGGRLLTQQDDVAAGGIRDAIEERVRARRAGR